MTEAVTEDEQLIFDAASSYRRRDFEKCSSIMEKLKGGKLNDTKIHMNKALLNYVYKSGCLGSEQYVRELKRIAAVEGVNLDDYDDKTCSLGRRNPERADEVCSSKDGLSNIAPQFVSRSSIAINLLYNYAVVSFYQRQYAQAEKLLANCLDIPINMEPADNKTSSAKAIPLTFQSPTYFDQPSSSLIQAMDLTPSTDTDLCRRIVLLWLEVCLRLFQVERVYQLCDYWLLCLNSMSVISETVNIPTNTQTDILLSPENANPHSRHLNSNALGVLIGIKKPIQLYYIRACLLTGRLYDAESELSVFISKDCSEVGNNSLEKNTDYKENSTEVEILSVNYDHSEGGEHSEKLPQSNPENISKHCSDIVWSTGNSVYFLQAQLAYLKGCYNDAMKLLSSIPSPSFNSVSVNDWESAIVKNNLSLIYYCTGRCTSSVLHLRSALKQVDRILQTSVQSVDKNLTCILNHQNGYFSVAEYSELLNKIPLHVSSIIEHHELAYNYGVQLLFSQRPSEAFSTLSQLVRIYPRNPRLWFRLAECCIKLHCPYNLSLWKMESRKRCVVESVGCGPFRKLMLAAVNSEAVKSSKVDESLLSSPSLEFASLALRNALLLLPTPPVKLITAQCLNNNTSGSSYVSLIKWSNKQFIPTYPSPTPLFGMGLLHFLSGLHVSTSYVALCLNQPVEVIQSASQVLDSISQSENNSVVDSFKHGTNLGIIAPKVHSYLCRLYYAEALTYLDRIDEASSLLQISTDNDLNSITRCLNGVCFEIPFLFPNVDDNQNSLSSSHTNESVTMCNQLNRSVPVNTRYRQPLIRPVDFPTNVLQASSLLTYNFAVTLAIKKQYRLSKQYLEISLPGLFLSASELDGRKWHPDLSGEPTLLNDCKILPTTVLLLCIYLEIGLGHRKQAAELLREHFGHLTMADRLNPLFAYNDETASLLPAVPQEIDPSLLAKNYPSLVTDLKQLINVQQQNITGNTTIPQIRPPPSVHLQQSSNRSTNLWTPCQQFRQSQAQQNQPVYYSPLLQTQIPPQTQPTLANYEYASRWDQPTSATGLITANNENDWPPLG
ncbi:unnamed protein product [Heterobilharzia americana]|nr:unnamed protein product [Heterobilharzia americana]